MRLNITDISLNANAAHRNANQITSCIQKATHACVLASSPRLVEPVLLIEVQVPSQHIGSVYDVILIRQGVVIYDEPRLGTPLHTIKAYLSIYIQLFS